VRRILLDQGLSPAAAALLRADGWDALHVMGAGLDRAEDIEILEFARRESRACVTLDHDFHAHLALAQMTGPSVVLVRLEGLDASDQAALIRRVWGSCADDIEAGAAVSVDAVSMRVRKLPLR
jgi:predicted nuclease of predicted toxin-antitoxin system